VYSVPTINESTVSDSTLCTKIQINTKIHYLYYTATEKGVYFLLIVLHIYNVYSQ